MTFIEDIILKEDAIFIADSHFKQGDNALIESFQRIPKGVQVFLMGDIFHLLIGALQSSRLENQELISIICHLSWNNSIIFLEGNHDFSLQSIWQNRLDSTNANLCNKTTLNRQKMSEYQSCLDSLSLDYNPSNIRIYSHSVQPIILRNWQNCFCILAHGDLWINPFYNQYRKILSSDALIYIFKLLDKLSYGIIYRNISCKIAQRTLAKFSFYRSDFVEFMFERIAQY
ncbi:hypothetical protein, partial [Helicobacter sp. MIT 14-3879]|uniref:hypothetical protein n=1 Tax=Helicobacter sp. MIT 14-3879 TaxID=2040649 RepID=UPI000E1E9F17